jgi:hypothetical protein
MIPRSYPPRLSPSCATLVDMKRRRTWLWIGLGAFLLVLIAATLLAPLSGDPVTESVLAVANAHGMKAVDPTELDSTRERLRNPLGYPNLPTWRPPQPSLLYSASGITEAEYESLAREVEAALMKFSTGGVYSGSSSSSTDGRLNYASREFSVSSAHGGFQAEVAIEGVGTDRPVLFLAITPETPSLWGLIKRRFENMKGGP